MQTTTKINASLSLLALISLAASFYPNWGLWGLDTSRSYSSWLRIILTALVLISSFPFISRICRDVLGKMESWSISRIKAFYITLGAILVGLFIIFSSQNHLLGDGYNIAGYIGAGNYFSPTELLDYSWHYLLHLLIDGLNANAFTAYAVGAYLAGVIMLIGVYRLTRDKGLLFLNILLIMSFTTFQFFFGYVESYTYSHVFILLYFLSGLKDISCRKLSPTTVILLLIAIAFHHTSIVFLPSLVYMLIRSDLTFKIKASVISVFSIMVIIAGILIIKHIDYEIIFAPLVPNERIPYSLFSKQHLHDLVNIFLLNYPLIILVPFILKYIDKAHRYFFALAIGAGLLFVVLIDPKIGAYRDWDLMSIAVAPMIALLIYSFHVWKMKKGFKIYTVLLPILAFAVLHTGGWIWQNTNKAKGYEIAKSIIHNDMHYSSDYISGYRNKSWGLLAGKYYNDHSEALRAWQVRYDGDPTDGNNIMCIAQVHTGIGDTTLAIEIIDSNWHRFLDKSDILKQMMLMLAESNHRDELMHIYTTLIDSNKADFSIYHDYGTLMSVNGKSDSAVVYYDLAYQTLSETRAGEQYAFYASVFIDGYDSIAFNGLLRIQNYLDGNNRQITDYILNTLRTNNAGEIDSLRAMLKNQRQSYQNKR